MIIRAALYLLLALTTIACHKKSSPANEPPPDNGPAELSHKVLVSNLNFPWQLLWGPDNMLWVSERPGKISRVDPDNGNITLLTTIGEVHPSGEGGLLGMVIMKSSAQQINLFVAYDYQKNNNYTGKVVRYNYENGTLSDPLTIIDDIQAAGIHNGCRLVISADQKLFITTGDASDQANPQNLDSRNGKILRVNPDGSIPNDNPDPTSPVWSYGHRNPQGLVLVDDILFSSEHGPDTDDEINIIEKGGNYGWPNVRGFCNEASEQTFCNEHDVVEPLKSWTPTIAVCGIGYYNSDSIPQWKNSILMATLKDQRLVQLELSDDHRTIAESHDFFINEYGRMRDVCVAPDGRVFICTSNGDNNDVIVQVSKK
jgi:glucose/arabinose dehydrogenase